MDELFGRDNFIAQFIWQDKYTTTNDKQGISSQTDYILCYEKKIEGFLPNKLPLREEYVKKTYRNDDNDGKGKYRLVQMYKKKNPKSYEVVSPTGKTWNLPWNFTKENFEQMDKENKIYWGKKGDAQPQKKVYLSESTGINPINLLLGNDVGFSQNGGNEIEKLFKNRNTFAYPKPEGLLKRIIEISTNENDLILDFCLGSGTTAAVPHKMNRQHIGIEQMDYIENVSVERLKKVISGEQGGISESVNWNGGGSFIYCELMNFNQEAIDLIQNSKDTEELIIIWDKICEKYFLNYDLDIHKFNNNLKEFKDSELDKQKEDLIKRLDKNQLYVNLSEIDDKKFNVDENVKRLNKSFYNITYGF
ncbi:MAG: site-specific DNA-methyltransferase [Methanobrevibacter sp.]|jgi:adenine-specific DNA-methyltransferase|nr:site-specific DNA-methyltransferase [Candidatus Methanoflexus mossambicus]